MPAAVIDSLEDVAEGLRGEYMEYEGDDDVLKGKFVLNVTPVAGLALEDVTGLKATLGKFKAENRDLKASVSGWDTLETTPDDVRTGMARLKELDDMDPDEQDKKAEAKLGGQHAAQIQAMERDTAAKIEPLETKVAKRDKQLDLVLRENQAKSAILAEKGSVKLLQPVLVNEAKVREDDEGDLVVELVDEFGNPRVDAKGNPVTFDMRVKEMMADPEYQAAFAGRDVKGPGTKPDATQRPGITTPGEKTPQDKIKSGLAALEARAGA